jgi:hypothetical protein
MTDEVELSQGQAVEEISSRLDFSKAPIKDRQRKVIGNQQ